jgi:tetratricopeptide (TPR) repeat protein
LNDAQDNYSKFDVIKSQKALATQATQNLADAKTAIDKASTNEKTATLPQTYAVKSAIYGALAMRDSVPATAEPNVTIAKDNLKKAQDADTKGENKKLIADAQLYIAIYYQTIGVKAYQDKKYDIAYQSFDNWAQSSGYKDTTALYYSALAATNEGNTNPKFYQNALSDYTKLLTTNYGAKAKVYGYMSTLYMQTKDTADAIKTIDSGVVKYPANTVLRESQVRIMLQAGRESELTGTFDKAIANDPNNKTLVFYAALAYSTIADKEETNALKAKDDASKAALIKQSDENYAKAADYYKKCLALDPTYFEATLNVGYVLMKPAIHLYNMAAALPQNATQKQYDDVRLQADAQFDVAYPYLQKAVDMNPKSSDALTNLRNYYRGKYDKAHAADNKAKAEDLKKQIDALSGK